ncbi:Holliday junction resolvase recU (Recombination protein U-like protein) [Mycoplasmoides gallisepticum str. R(low)]|uniref:Holliday junction resolvase RecU n=1 Tax=Mycoplasmoides gallisepticum (strain R(low / passage 15 / clone 2)) TaxID=710127 RepID=Q7NBW8_MYCGA|nr:Holliday junction resolvase RecU [Mycoplasmoides gallisepticum]AAP56492.2 Holliday junction resolvase recU (Recombination protein U-like protein) [Mycoplasmoides gallisepticum str. R(low)]ADC30325.1 Holliday junction resolvase recU (Recombination protein U-like protein) [Mycoplasmoides gallisepticum str. R(high)]
MHQNRGMFLETLINNTIKHNELAHKGLIFKRHLPINVYNFANRRVTGWLKEKTQTDYYGLYKGYFFDFDAKQSSKINYSLKNIKQHQLDHLRKIHEQGGIAFILLLIVPKEEFYMIPIKKIDSWLKNQESNTLKYEWIQKSSFKLELFYPGVIGIFEALQEWIDLITLRRSSGS